MAFRLLKLQEFGNNLFEKGQVLSGNSENPWEVHCLVELRDRLNQDRSLHRLIRSQLPDHGRLHQVHDRHHHR